MLKDIFKDKDVKDIDNAISDLDSQLRITGDRARLCLNHNDFKAYRESYKRLEESVVDFMLAYNKSFQKDASGVEKYAFVISGYLTRLQVLKSLVSTIETQAKRGNGSDKKSE